ncbi:ubiquitin-conjugating enzyme family protein [Streptomyces sp. NPDC012842]|uniref:ubiquitin-conjugating enzyme family protein n=1 Tax=Streptomyces TaxID=1883 RepID=UPI0033F068B7
MAGQERRLRKELEALAKDPPETVGAAPYSEDDLRLWKGHVLGAEGTPHERGFFQLEMSFPADYPFVAPKVRFITHVYHPNVRANAISAGFLADEWSPVLTVEKVLLSVQSLLATPDLDKVVNDEAARLYKEDRTAYDEKAREVTQRYAM